MRTQIYLLRTLLKRFAIFNHICIIKLKPQVNEVNNIFVGLTIKFSYDRGKKMLSRPNTIL